jgi:hypothetical protein
LAGHRFEIINAPDASVPVAKDGIIIGRVDTCDLVLDHKTVSRVHAGINYVDGRFIVANLSSSNTLTINGRPLRPKESDVLADGDTIQIGPFILVLDRVGDTLKVSLTDSFATDLGNRTASFSARDQASAQADQGDVLKVFWEKRSREKEDWGSRLRPTAKPIPGKAMFNWKPTNDLRRPWRAGVFVWAVLLLGSAAVFAFYKYPNAYSPRPLSSAHAKHFDESTIAVESNSNSCTTCHAPNEPVENSCIKCHSADQFHATNTRAHEDAGVTCTVCHLEHRGADFSPNAYAIASCASCHSDENKNVYNGKAVQTTHGGSYGYPLENGEWNWKGVYQEVAAAVPEITGTATGDADEQAKRSRHFHAIHVARLTVPAGLKGDSAGLVSCSTCHKSFEPIDRVTPKETCASCHMNQAGDTVRDQRFKPGEANCISCHVQHPFSGKRWREFVSDEAYERRKESVARAIEDLKTK